jgi:uncharacterized membrane protein
MPLGLLSMVWVFDLVGLTTGKGSWANISFWLCTCGLIGGLVAGIVGFLDFLDIPSGTRAYRVALNHLLVQLGALAVFGLSWGLRFQHGIYHPQVVPFVLALFGTAGLGLGGWLGAELVQQHGVGVRREAHLDAPSSLDADRLVRRPTPLEPSEPQPA